MFLLFPSFHFQYSLSITGPMFIVFSMHSCANNFVSITDVDCLFVDVAVTVSCPALFLFLLLWLNFHDMVYMSFFTQCRRKSVSAAGRGLSHKNVLAAGTSGIDLLIARGL